MVSGLLLIRFTSIIVFIWWTLGFFSVIPTSVSINGFGEVFIGILTILFILTYIGNFISSLIFTPIIVFIWWLLGFFTNILPSVSLRGFGEVFIGIFAILFILTYMGIFFLSLTFTSVVVFIWWLLGFFTNILPSVSLRGFGEVFIGIFITLYVLFMLFHIDEEESEYKQWREDPTWLHGSSSGYQGNTSMHDGGSYSPPSFRFR